MTKEQFTFINDGNGIEGIISKGHIDKEESAKPKVLIQKKNSELVWDPVFECFVPKKDDNTLEKGTVSIQQKHVK